jgi:LmbE family N-acetylglucosaminyl deacetylase
VPSSHPSDVVDALSTGRAALPASIALVVAHPDDEVVGIGGRLMWWADRTTIVHVTDGAPADGVDARRAGFRTLSHYALARWRETWTALAWLPQQPRAVLRLGFVDQRVTDDVGDVVAALQHVVRDRSPQVLMTHAYEGGHPDHDAIVFAVQALRTIRDLPPFEVVEFAEYHEGTSGALVTNRFADTPRPDGRVAARLRAQDRRRKRLMLDAFGSQRRTLASFRCDEEWLRPAPAYDFSRPPAYGPAWFDRCDWGTTSREWRAHVARAAARLASERTTC